MRNYDFIIVIGTVIVLAILGFACLFGIIYAYESAKNIPNWEYSKEYSNYVSTMNKIATPIVVALLILLSLCIPKRVFPRNILNITALVLIGIFGIISILFTYVEGLLVLLVIMLPIQTAVLILTLLKFELKYEKRGYLTQIGSSMIHLGIIVFILNFVALRTATIHLMVFYISMVLICVGSAFTFYTQEIYEQIKKFREI
ncbi:MAG: hypothetical protein HY929_07955 [Euryarchaeota archaeon]|nr:hypothetical protein [Euryarchaeota archaeon]